jgi:hypothetical protein
MRAIGDLIMPLEKRYMEIQLGVAGEQEGTDDTFKQAPALDDSLNVQIIKGGALERRVGYKQQFSISWSSLYHGLTMLMRVAHRRILFWDDGWNTEQYNVTETSGTEISTGCPSTITSEHVLISDKFEDYDYGDCCYYNNHIYICYTECNRATSDWGGYRYYAVFKEDDLMRVNDGSIASGVANHLARTRVVAAGGKIFFIYAKSGGGLYYRIMSSLPNGSLGTETRIGSFTINSTNYDGWDICAYGDYIWIVYYNSSNSVSICYIDSNGTIVQALTYSGYPVPDSSRMASYPAITVSHSRESTDPASAKVALTYGPSGTNNQVVNVIYQANLGSVIGAGTDYYGSGVNNFFTSLSSGWITYSGTLYCIVRFSSKYTVDPWTVNMCPMMICSFLATDGSLHTDNYYYGYAARSKLAPFYGYSFGTISIWYNDPANVNELMGIWQRYYNSISICASFNQPLTPNGYPLLYNAPVDNHIASIAINANGKLYWLETVKLFQVKYSGTPLYRNGIILNSIEANDYLQKLQHPSSLVDGIAIPGSFPILIHNGIPVELGGTPSSPIMPRPPDIYGAGSLTTGTYYYKFAYRTLAGGLSWISKTSEPVKAEITSENGSCNLYVPSCMYNGYGPDQYKLEIYRTLVNGSVYHKLSFDNRPYGDQWDDDESDATIEENPVLYTTGGIVENFQCPPCTCMAEHQNRLWVAHMVTGDIYYSKRKFQNEGYSFSQYLILDAPKKMVAKNIVSLSYYHLILFYPSETYFVLGEGPNDQGLGGSYTVQQLSNKVGLRSIHSAIRASDGLYFGGDEGIYKVDLGLSAPLLISDGIRDTYQTKRDMIVGATEISKTGDIRWVCSDGTMLVYNQRFNAWTTWSTLTESGYVATNSYSDGSNHLVSTAKESTKAGKEIASDDTYYKDDQGAIYTSSFTTPWIDLAGIVGYQRVWKALLFVEKGSDSDQINFTVTIYTDYKTTEGGLTQTISITDSQIHNVKPLILELGIANQRCTAIKFKVVADSSSYSVGVRVKFKAMRLEYGILPTAAKTPRLNA